MNIGPFDFSNLPGWLQTVLAITAIAGALIAIGAFIRKTWPVVIQFVQTVISLQTLPDFMDQTTETLAGQNVKIAEIHHEVQFNNGSSVKDAVTRVEKSQKVALVNQQRLEDGIKGLYNRTEVLEQTSPKPPATRRRAPKKE